MAKMKHPREQDSSNLFSLEFSLPDPACYPTNIGNKTLHLIRDDMRQSISYLIVTGYSSLEFLVGELGGPDAPQDLQLEILLGNEPRASDKGWHRKSDRSVLPKEISEYWMEKGIAPHHCGAVIRLIEGIREGRITVRYLPDLHAKIHVGDHYAVLGSSNFSFSGLWVQTEANVRRRSGTPEYEEMRRIAKCFFREGHPFDEPLIDLLSKLLRFVTWREALGRAVGEIIEGDWMNRYPNLLQRLEALKPPLWPSQIEAIGQALQVLDEQGSVLIADPTGSGKTRMGAALHASIVNRIWLRGQDPSSTHSLLISPPQVTDSWKREFGDFGDFRNIFSQGGLSRSEEHLEPAILREIRNARILFLDEAHNFLSRTSIRSMRLQRHAADTLVLFTATPINKKVEDLFRLIEILDLDNLSDEAIANYGLMLEQVRKGIALSKAQSEILRSYIRDFIIRRTKKEINEKIAADPESYRNSRGEVCRYPAQRCKVYALNETERDIALAHRINQLAQGLHGLVRLRHIQFRPDEIADPARAIAGRLNGAKALTIYNIQAMLRSSNAALYEHFLGTRAAAERYGLGVVKQDRQTGNIIAKLKEFETILPHIDLLGADPSILPSWLRDHREYARKCREEKAIYAAMAQTLEEMSTHREERKAQLLVDLLGKHDLVLAYDSCIITLHYIHKLLASGANPPDILLVTGQETTAKKKAIQTFEFGSQRKGVIGLLTDTFSEGVNLQQASSIVFLDTPSVMRVAEQRVGRIDRLNSPHPEIEIHFSDDNPEFALKTDRKFFRTAVAVEDTIGGNLDLPQELFEKWEVECLSGKAMANLYEEEAAKAEDRFLLGVQDAFQPVRELVFGKEALVDPHIYHAMKHSKAKVVSRVELSLVRSRAPWALFSIRATDYSAPYWIFIETESGFTRPKVIRELPSICEKLRHHLVDVVDLEAHEAAAISAQRMNAFVSILREHAIESLPNKKRRALQLLRSLLAHYLKAIREDGLARDKERKAVLQSLQEMLNPGKEDQEVTVDLSDLARHWIEVITPFLQEARLRKNRRTSSVVHILTLEKRLKQHPIDTGTLQVLEGKAKPIPSVEKRIASCILGLDLKR